MRRCEVSSQTSVRLAEAMTHVLERQALKLTVSMIALSELPARSSMRASAGSSSPARRGKPSSRPDLSAPSSGPRVARAPCAPHAAPVQPEAPPPGTEERPSLSDGDRALCALAGASAALAWAGASVCARQRFGALHPALQGLIGLLLASLSALLARAFRLEQLEQARLRPPEALADPDSSFGSLQGVRVHYKALSDHARPEPADNDDPSSLGSSWLSNGASDQMPKSQPQQPTSTGFRFTSMGFIHGFGASIFSWEYGDTLRKLSRGLRALVVAHDSPGFGLTHRTKQPGKYSIATNAAITRELLDLEARRQSQTVASGGHVLVGHSLGGLVAAQAASQGAISACVLVAPAIAFSFDKQRGLVRFLSNAPLPLRFIFASLACISDMIFAVGFFCAKPFILIALRGMVRKKKFWWRGLQIAWANSDAVTQELVDGYYKPQAVEGWDVGLLRFVRSRFLPEGVRRQMLRRLSRALRMKRRQQALTSSPTPISTSESEMLKQLESVPTLIVHGTKDRLVALENSRALAEHLDCKLVEMDGVGHTPHEEAPDDFVAHVNSWLKSGALSPEDAEAEQSMDESKQDKQGGGGGEDLQANGGNGIDGAQDQAIANEGLSG